MKKSKLLLAAILGALTVSGCTFTPSNHSTNSTPISSVSTADTILDEIAARVIFIKDKQEVVDDFEVPALVKFNYEGTEINVNITWTADKNNVVFEEVEGVLTGVLNRPEFGEEPVTVNITASFEYEGKTGSKKFKVIVMPKTGLDDVWGTAPVGTPMSWSDFRNAEKGSVATIQGRVIAWTYDGSYGNGNVFLQDNNGGYYAYRIKAALSEYEDYLEVGNEVIIEGKKDVFSGLHQLGQDTVTGIKVVSRENAGKKPEPKDVTTAAKNGELEPLQSTWVTVLGTYTTDSEGYKYIQVGGNKYQIYSDKKYNGENLDAVNAQLAGLAEGDTIRLKGIVGVYNNPQFYPYDVVKSDEVITVTDEEKVEIDKTKVFDGFAETYNETTEAPLYASIEESVTITYALNAEANTEVFALGTDKLTVTPTETEEKATLTATIVSGSVSETVSIELTAVLPAENKITYTIDNAMPEGLSYITNNDSFPNPSFYSNGGLKMNYENMGVLTETFDATSYVKVGLNVLALNENTKTGSSEDAFTVYGLNASGETVATATLQEVVAGENFVELNGAGIVQVKVLMTAYPNNGTKFCNVSLGGVSLEFFAVSYEINNAMPEGLSYITNNDSFPNPSFYSNGGLKMNYENMGVLTETFDAKASLNVTLNVLSLNENTKTGSSEDAFTVYGLNASGETVATATLQEVVAGENTVTITGEGIVQVKVLMTAYPNNGTKFCNVSLGGLSLKA